MTVILPRRDNSLVISKPPEGFYNDLKAVSDRNYRLPFVWQVNSGSATYNLIFEITDKIAD